MKYNFDEIVQRKHTDCLKYDNVKEIFGTEEILPMWIADMDFRTPDFIVDAIRNRLSHELLGYSYICKRWRPAIQSWVSRRYGWHVEADEIGFVGGIVPAISFAMQCFTKHGDKVMIQPPVYHPYHHVTHDLERTLVFNPLKLVNGQLEIDFVDFEEKVKDCKLFLLCNPHNPCGRVWTREELKRMCDICVKYNVLVISDEIHCDMALKGYKHTPFASVSEDAKNNSITFMAASKTFNIAGIVTSYAIVPNSNLREKFFGWMEGNELNHSDIFAPIATVAAFEQGEEWRAQMIKYVEENVEFTIEFCREHIPKITPIRPEASFLVWLDCRKLGFTHAQLVDLFVNKAALALNDGAMFGTQGEGFMRLNVGTPRTTLQKALTQLKEAISHL